MREEVIEFWVTERVMGVDVAAVVGTPESIPIGDKVSPAGRGVVAAQVMGARGLAVADTRGAKL